MDEIVEIKVRGYGHEETFEIRVDHPEGVGIAAAMAFAERHPECRHGNTIMNLTVDCSAVPLGGPPLVQIRWPGGK